MRRAALLLAAGGVFLFPARPAFAQAPASAAPDIVSVFLDCQTQGCDSSHFRSEITFVSWVRDRTVADVHLLITSQGAGGGGEVYALSFIGLRAFAADTLRLDLSTGQNLTDAERRDELTNRIAQGLLYFAARSGAAARIRVSADEPSAEFEAAAPARDPWNFWVFDVDANASVDGESREASQEYRLSAGASRVTAALKLELEARGSYEKERFELSEGEETFVTRNWNAEALATRALAERWSAGATVETGRSTFENQRFYVRPAAVLEYSFYPYEDFSRRRVTLQYSLGARHSEYDELTIYGVMSERRADQGLQLTAEFRQPWGSAEWQLSGSHYLHNINRYSASTQLELDLRLFRGLSLNVEGSYSRVHDQLYVPAGEADDEEVLLRRQALETNYRYRTSVGLSYTFGSVYNNVVNPRIERGDDFEGRGR